MNLCTDSDCSYQLANKLSERLDEMAKDLGSMIDEINDASSTLSQNSKADDPVSIRISMDYRRQILLTTYISSHKSSEFLTAILLNYSRLTKVPPR